MICRERPAAGEAGDPPENPASPLCSIFAGDSLTVLGRPSQLQPLRFPVVFNPWWLSVLGFVLVDSQAQAALSPTAIAS